MPSVDSFLNNVSLDYSVIIIYTTCPSRKEAEKISMHLLKKKLAGCCNIFPVKSSYLWNGKIEKADEFAIIIKTGDRSFNAIEKEIKKLHSYEVPCIEGWKISHAEKNYAKWFETELKGAGKGKKRG